MNIYVKSKTRSSFVTTLAWCFIILSGFVILISIAQNVMIHSFFPMEDFVLNGKDTKGLNNGSMFFDFVTKNMPLFFAMFFVFSAVVFISSIGLLKRKKWARNIFVFIMALTILWNIGSVAIEFFVVSDFNEFLNNPKLKNNENLDNFRGMMIFMKGFTILLALIFSVFFGWIIKRLVTEPVKYEFK